MITERDRTLARAVRDAFGGKPQVHRYYDQNESHHIDVAACFDRPEVGLASVSTLGLYAYPNLLDGRDVRVELAAIAPAYVDEVGNALASAAFQVMKEGWLAAPGVVFKSMLRDYRLSRTLDHILWVVPARWPSLAELRLEAGLECPLASCHADLGD